MVYVCRGKSGGNIYILKKNALLFDSILIQSYGKAVVRWNKTLKQNNEFKDVIIQFFDTTNPRAMEKYLRGM